MQLAHIRPPPDLNLLRVFRVLMEERSVTRAGERLALSQSAVSHALARLRDALGDELFVRSAEGMRPTVRAQEIAPGVSDALARLEEALAVRAFDPAATTRRFRVGASVYVCATLLAGVTPRFRQEAPQATLAVRPGQAGAAENLDAGRVDLVIGAFGHIPERFAVQPLYQETMVWALCARHPAARNGKPPAAVVASLPRLMVASEEPDETRGGRVFEHGLERRVVWDDPAVLAGSRQRAPASAPAPLVVPDAHTALILLPGADLAGLLPLRLARPAAKAGVLVLVRPDPAPPPNEIVALWRRERGADPGLLWFRGLVADAAAELEPL